MTTELFYEIAYWNCLMWYLVRLSNQYLVIISLSFPFFFISNTLFPPPKKPIAIYLYLIVPSSECCNYLNSTDALMIPKSTPYQCAFFITLFFFFVIYIQHAWFYAAFSITAGVLILWCLHFPGKVITQSYTNVFPVLLNDVAVLPCSYNQCLLWSSFWNQS